VADTRGSHWSIGLALAACGYVFLVLGWNRPKRGNRTEQAPHLSPQKACFCEQCAKRSHSPPGPGWGVRNRGSCARRLSFPRPLCGIRPPLPARAGRTRRFCQPRHPDVLKYSFEAGGLRTSSYTQLTLQAGATRCGNATYGVPTGTTQTKWVWAMLRVKEVRVYGQIPKSQPCASNQKRR
jgi:hypothetical protein